jgi:predicted nucleic acid-binding Zn ribbon protein
MSEHTASGADLARQALAAARAAAKTNPAPGPKKPRRSVRPTRGTAGDPQGLGSVLARLTAEQGWEAGIGGGNLLDQWPQICPTELATTVQPVSYDAERGILELRPSSPAYATQLRLFQQHLVKHLNERLGRPAVRAIRVLAPGAATAVEPAAEHEKPATPEEPVKTRETASAGYREVLALALQHRPEPEPGNPYVAEADRRQVQALRTNRQSETEHREAMWFDDQPTGPAPGSMEASEAAAIAYKRQDAAGLVGPRRLFGAA